MPKRKDTEKEMIGGCCVCSDDRGWTENPLVYCDGEGCNVAVHQACYGIVTIPTTNWYCRKCETPDLDQVKCELCPSSIGALKPTDGRRGWAHVVCALYIPEVSFGNVTTMEPIIINQVPQERFNKTCYICEEGGKGAVARIGACMQCNRSGCRQVFHVTCAQAQGLLCEEAGNYQDNVKYCGYCHHHYNKLKKGGHVKPIPPYRPMSSGDEIHEDEPKHTNNKRKLSSGGGGGGNSAKGKGGSAGGDTVACGGEDSNSQLPNGDSGELKATPVPVTGATKKRKSGVRTATAAVTQVSHDSGGVAASQMMSGSGGMMASSESPRPLTPSAVLRPISPSLSGGQAYSNANGGVTKVGSIVVQVPLEAAGVGGSPPPLSTSASPPPPPLSSTEHPPASITLPAKRSRSESSDKGEKRRSKRSGSGVPRPHRKSSPSSRVKLSPEPVGVMLASVGLSGGGVTATTMSTSVKLTSSGVPPSSSSSATSIPILPLSLSNSTTLVFKEEKDVKLFENGVGAAHMLGNQLAPGSSMADTLSQEVAAHSMYTRASSSAASSASSHVGPHFPRPTPYRGPGAGGGSSGGGGLTWGTSGSNMPQSLEQLLERQWEQGSQFLMEQAHHFDIASLLSCLHQLKAENAQLEEHVNSLQARRDNLLAVNARLAIPLVNPHSSSSSTAGGNNVTGRLGTSVGGTGATSVANATIASAVLSNTNVTSIVENGLPSAHEQYRLSTLHRLEGGGGGRSGGGGGGYSGSHAGSVQVATSGGVTPSSGGGSSNIQQVNQSSVVVRASSATPQPPSSNSQTLPQPRSSSAGGGYGSSSFSSNNPQVLVRRTEESLGVHNKIGSQQQGGS